MIVSEKVTVSWQRRNIRHYKSLGYQYTGIGDEFLVKVKDLTLGSHVLVECQCDVCGNIVEKPYKAYLSQTKNNAPDVCSACAYTKAQTSNKKKYGVINPMQHEPFKKKLVEALHKNGTAPSSSQQRHIHTLIGGKLNYPQDAVMLDIAFPDEKVYLEYDGSGHELQVKFGAITQEEFEKQERKRSYFLYRKGWKEIRIISDDDKLPVDSAIKDFANRARSFFNAKNPPFSIHWNLNTGVVVINHKMNSSIEDFLLEDFPLEEKEVS